MKVTTIACLKKRALPLSYNCDPRQLGSCHKGDLISTGTADCKKDSLIVTCDPINDQFFSSVIDVPDVSRHGVNCVANRNRPIICGTPGTDTRCVCDKAVDVKRPKGTLFNQCRCQYWPQDDPRTNQPSFCTQFDNGGRSNVHFYTCCNNCNDLDSSCDTETYQGGGSTDAYCSSCGQNSQLGGGRATYRFNCVSCTQQRTCERECSSGFGGFITRNTPSLCPRWSGCFRGCCTKAQKFSGTGQRKKQTDTVIDVGEFCGDFMCQEDESHETCPADCCPIVNPTSCNQQSCNPNCCLHPSCCGFNSTTTNSSYSNYHLMHIHLCLYLLTVLFSIALVQML